MPNLKTMGPLLLCLLVSLQACRGQVVTKLQPIPAPPPEASLSTCQDSPEKPAPGATQKTAALILVEFEEALADCKAKLAALVKTYTP